MSNGGEWTLLEIYCLVSIEQRSLDTVICSKTAIVR